MLSFFKRSYAYTPPQNAERPDNSSAAYVAEHWDAAGSPLKVSYASWVNPVSSWLRLGFEALGIPSIPSFYGGSLLGWSWLAVTLDPRTQVRSSAQDFLLEALIESPNLYVYKSTLARRILFDGTTATGVLVDSGGVTYNLTANREVIVSAGVMRSPQLLLVSGVGSEETLNKINVSLVADRPGVGQNLWDNVLVGPTFEVNIVTHSSLQNTSYLAQSIQEYNERRSGMLTNSGGDIAAFEKLNTGMVSTPTLEALNETFPADWPHIEYLILDAYFGTGNDSSPGVSDGKQYVASSVGLVATFSRGNVTVSTSDVSDNPVISPNWLLDPRDQDIAIAAFRRGRELFGTDVMSSIVVDEVYPGTQYTTDEQILSVIRESANSVYNAAGTNKMGIVDDPMAVVDSKARVIGVERLRVVDASIFPFLPPGQPSAIVYALAEKISEDIKRDQ
ncbi:putative versicolorin b synthase [Rosellinia necatrix]|uniref:Putative versicolorin b synthase n=1 Tax=Rosellinia necatrix TaxID=77044 RepID=A0A1S8ABN3_ROSNE|nr:putative versicolorin b synthase [Rosellinia necatrix]